MISIIVAFQDQKTPSSLTVITCSKISRSSSMVKGPTAASGFGDGIEEAVTRFEKEEILLMEEILHHLGCIKPCKLWDIYHTSWCRIYQPYEAFLGGFLEESQVGGRVLDQKGMQKDPAARLRPWCRAPPPVGNTEGLQVYISWKLLFSNKSNVLQADFLGWNLIRPFSKMLQYIYCISFFLR